MRYSFTDCAMVTCGTVQLATALDWCLPLSACRRGVWVNLCNSEQGGKLECLLNCWCIWHYLGIIAFLVCSWIASTTSRWCCRAKPLPWTHNSMQLCVQGSFLQGKLGSTLINWRSLLLYYVYHAGQMHSLNRDLVLFMTIWLHMLLFLCTDQPTSHDAWHLPIFTEWILRVLSRKLSLENTEREVDPPRKKGKRKLWSWLDEHPLCGFQDGSAAGLCGMIIGFFFLVQFTLLKLKLPIKQG